MFDVQKFRHAFPALASPRIYLDSAATALKPQAMIDATMHYYSHNSATVNRSLHLTAFEATQQFEQARQTVADFINAPSAAQIIWTSGTTASINLVAQMFAQTHLTPGDEIIVSEFEHHSNLIPWLMVAKQKQCVIKPWRMENQSLDIDWLTKNLTAKTKLIAITQMSNITGYQPDLKNIIQRAHHNGSYVLVDGAQGIVHEKTNVQSLDADFYCFSAHKLYSSTGVGVLYGKKALLASMPLVQGGGKMLTDATLTDFSAMSVPACFEAGTPNIAGIIGFGATLAWLSTIDLSSAHHYTQNLVNETEKKLATLPGFISYRAPDSPLLSFNFTGIHHSDIATIVAEHGIALRHGKICAQPLIDALGVSGILRASFAPYNTQQESDALFDALHSALHILES